MTDPIEQIFLEVAQETAINLQSPRDITEDESYQLFIESMIPFCHCSSQYCPCDGVLAGGLCDGIVDDERDDYIWEDEEGGREYEEN